jgi:N-methylhydantoinase B
VWTEERYEALTDILAHVATSWRFFVKHRIFRELGEAVAPEGGGAGTIYDIYDCLTRQFPDLPKADAGGSAPATGE